MSVQIKAEIIIPGDRSVGISESTIKIDIGTFSNYDEFLEGYDGGRDSFRKGLVEWAQTWFDSTGIYVLFGDECPDCSKRTWENNCCTNKNCISNMPED